MRESSRSRSPLADISPRWSASNNACSTTWRSCTRSDHIDHHGGVKSVDSTRQYHRPCAIATRGVAREDRPMEVPDTRYAVTPAGVYLAYRRLGQGTIDMLVQFDWIGNVDTVIDVESSTRALWREVASYARVIFYDRRGTGLSRRNVSPPNLETAVADTQVVLDAIGSRRPVLFGFLPEEERTPCSPRRSPSGCARSSGSIQSPARSGHRATR